MNTYFLGYDDDSYVEYYAIENDYGFTYMTYDVNTLKQVQERPRYSHIEWKEVSQEKFKTMLHEYTLNEIELYSL